MFLHCKYKHYFFDLKYLGKIFFSLLESLQDQIIFAFSAEEGERSVLHMSVGLKLSWALCGYGSADECSSVLYS